MAQEQTEDQIEQDQTEQEPGEAVEAEENTTGFTPDQQRFLWRVGTIVIVAVLGGALINIAYGEFNRSRDRRRLQLEDDHAMAMQRRQMAEQNDVNLIARAVAYMAKTHEKNPEIEARIEAARDDLLQAFIRERDANQALRQDEGLPNRATRDEEVAAYQNSIETRVNEQVPELVSQLRMMPTTQRSTTQPTTSQPTTGPVGPPAPATQP